MKRKVLISIVASLMLFSTVAFANTGNSSYASISRTETGADGPSVPMEGIVLLTGHNYSSSTNRLWVELYQQQAGPDWNVGNFQLNADESGSEKYGLEGDTLNYYVHLDPNGPYCSECIGEGKAEN